MHITGAPRRLKATLSIFIRNPSLGGRYRPGVREPQSSIDLRRELGAAWWFRSRSTAVIPSPQAAKFPLRGSNQSVRYSLHTWRANLARRGRACLGVSTVRDHSEIRIGFILREIVILLKGARATWCAGGSCNTGQSPVSPQAWPKSLTSRAHSCGIS